MGERLEPVSFNESITIESVLRDQVKTVTAETLRNLSRQTGCATIVTAIFRNSFPSEKARIKLTKENDWSGALREIYKQRTSYVFSFINHQGRLSEDYTRSVKYQQELAQCEGLKIVNFYRALSLLLCSVVSQKEWDSAFEGYQDIYPPPSYATRASYAVNFGSVERFFIIPDNPQDQLKLVNELGPQIFRSWNPNQ